MRAMRRILTAGLSILAFVGCGESAVLSMTGAGTSDDVEGAVATNFQGLFQVAGGIYYSDGQFYCSFSSWNHFTSSTGQVNTGNVAQVLSHPSGLTDRGVCLTPSLAENIQFAPVPALSSSLLSYPAVVPVEVPPTIVSSLSGGSLVFFSTDFSYRCNVGSLGLQGLSNLSPTTSCFIDTAPFLSEHAPVTGTDAPRNAPATDFRRTYNGVFSAHRIGNQIISINHGENKNQWQPFGVPTLCTQNTVRPAVVCTNSPSLTSGGGCASGVYNGVWHDCRDAYFAFVSASVRGLDGFGLQDLGPIVWPTKGYLTSSGGLATNLGVRQPSSIVFNDYLYVFYLEVVDSAVSPDRNSGVKVARAPLLPGGGVGVFQTYYRCGASFSQDCFETSLPSGFSKTTIRSFYALSGGRSSSVFSSSRPDLINRFSVARIINTRLFAGVAFENGAITLRVSSDLIHWGKPVTLSGISTNGFSGTKFLYVNFLNRDGTAHDQIDLAGFRLIGSSGAAISSATLSTTKLLYSNLVSSQPLPPPPPIVFYGSGFFRVGGGIYYANAQQHYCGFKDWASFVAAGGSPQLSNVTVFERMPQNLISDGVCR
jgi:hypothetical protein